MFSVNNILSENNSNIQQNIIISIMSHTRVIRSLRTLMLCVHILNSFRKEGGLKYFYVRLSAEKKNIEKVTKPETDQLVIHKGGRCRF